MDKIEQNEKIMKKFEKMINTADEHLAGELISDSAAFYTPASLIWHRRHPSPGSTPRKHNSFLAQPQAGQVAGRGLKMLV